MKRRRERRPTVFRRVDKYYFHDDCTACYYNAFRLSLVVRRVLTSFVHERMMGILASTEQFNKHDRSQSRADISLKSPTFIKKLYENPSGHLGRIVNVKDFKASPVGIEHQDRLAVYLQELIKLKPQCVRDWDLLRHHLNAIYRQLISVDPREPNDYATQSVLKEVREIVERLLVEDATQLFLRLFAVVREYVLLAQQLFCANDTAGDTVKQTFALIAITKYYCALYTAAGILTSVLPEFNQLLKEKYRVTWLLLNKAIFFKYFYQTVDVKPVLLKLDKLQLPPEKQIQYAQYFKEYKKLKVEMEVVDKAWCKTLFEIAETRRQMMQIDPSFMDETYKMLVEHKEILLTNFWLPRSQEQKTKQDMAELDSQIILWVGDKDIIAGQLLNFQGTCLCAECLIDGFKKEKLYPLPGEMVHQEPLEVSPPRHSNINKNGEDFKNALTDTFKKMLAKEASANACEARMKKDEKENAAGEANGEDSDEDDDQQDEAGSLRQPSPAQKRPQKPLSEIDPKVLNLLKNSNSNQKTNGRSPTFPCGHTCNLSEDLQVREGSCCAHHTPEYKKCDCTYCEVFGSSVSMISHKTNETRDRLRTRLNQRKEKFNTTVSRGKANMESLGAIAQPSPKQPPRKPDLSSRMPAPARVPDRVPNHPIPTDHTKPEQKNGIINPKAEASPLSRSLWSVSTISLNSVKDNDNTDSRDINDLLNYIEGTKNVDKLALAQKKAAKKARQKQKKELERLKIEEEKTLAEQRALEEKRKEEERLKAEKLAKELAEKAKKKKAQQEEKSKKGKKQSNNKPAVEEKKKHLLEETIPAMVTIKRIVENNTSVPTVTITLKGSTPDQDKLLYTLVNGYSGQNQSNNNKSNESTKSGKKKKKAESTAKNAQPAPAPEANSTSKKNNKNGLKTQEVTKELKVTLAVDKPVISSDNSNKKKKDKKINNTPKVETNNSVKNTKTEDNSKKNKPTPKSASSTNKDSDLNIPIRLPPGITITKVDGPVSNKNCKPVNGNIPHHNVTRSVPMAPQQNSRVPVSKSGVIVVDTEKLIQQSVAIANSKKQKKKKNKKNQPGQETKESQDEANHSMVSEKMAPEIPVIPCNQQASIIKNENGMVTIRSPRLQQSLVNGAPMPNLLTELKPVIGPDVSTPCLQTCHTNFSDNCHISSLNAQEILSGLPGIEITKVDKRTVKNDVDHRRTCQAADVSIIPTSNNVNGEKFSLDRDDWHYESVFIPKDILEDDLDAEERELEAFKRFCQQSVPPERKEKVAHLNVKDIVLKKKTDATYI